MSAIRFWSFCVVACLVVASPALAQEKPVYLDATQPIEKRIDDLLSKLTLEEKVSLCHADSIFATAGVPRLGIPELTMADGPMGVREDVGAGFRPLNRNDDFATAMPCPIAMAATWDTELLRLAGQVIGQEARFRGKHVMLNPAVNIMRSPLGGRTFEYFGEDPFLTARLAVSFIQGEQAEGIAACAKHFAVNNQETQRGSIDVEIDERALREIYLPAFEASVKEAGVLTIMGAYNKVRGAYCCENDFLLNKVLKGQWGFKGVVLSDWGGTHTTDGAALGGLDIEMGTNPPYERNFLATPFLEGLKSGKYPMSVVDGKVRRILYVMFKLNLIGADVNSPRGGALNTPEHQAIARRVAEEGMVLLKNTQSLLPIDLSKTKTIAVIGDNAVQKFAHSGFGATVKSPYEITALEGITKYVGDRAKITTAAGYTAPTGRGGRRGRGAAAPSTAPNAELLQAAVAAAKEADTVLFIGGLNHTRGYDDEGTDRFDMKLPSGQDELIAQLVAANPRTVVVLIAGSPVEMPWLREAPAVLQAWYGGMEAGNALARVLFGEVNPSGRLPYTSGKQLTDYAPHALNAFPGSNGVVKYEEGLLVGYRWFDAKQVEPHFPFGHGLSYTKFEYSNLSIMSQGVAQIIRVSFDVANTGSRDGAEVAQIYVQDLESTLARPIKELKGFRKVNLRAGEKRTIEIPLDGRAFAHYDPAKSAWVIEAGGFKFHVGSSSRDIRLTTDEPVHMFARTLEN